ncbi:MAG TPA: prolipoprotein diacylglyceryl transferase, partial [Acidimicrobiales bacterium]
TWPAEVTGVAAVARSTGLARLVGSIPSPGSNQIVLGPLHLRAYGLAIALGVFAAIEIARRRWAARGGNPEDMSAIAIWAVPAGLIGARIYHVVTDNELYRGHWFDNPFGAGAHSPLAIWSGGLGIPGGIALGVAVGLYVAHRRGIRPAPGLDVVAPAIAVAQAIGRLGNYFNQELYGRPTSLPWGLEISPVNRPRGYELFATYQPTFLYEALWNLALAGLLVLIDRRRVLRPGRIFALYIGGYAIGRFLVESLRIDAANKILGLRVNIWTSLIAFGGVVLFLAVKGLRRRPGDSDEPYVDGHRFDLVRTEAVDPDEDDTGAPADDGAPAADGDPAEDGESETSVGEQGS